ncbi:ThiF family adenylyltransferase [Pyxidicoccus sp. MSG2]|uniref:ThiF family adenylyltransferase n=1 Tax=Pyxidicoccus sp. MSG2 TaxID=2996790 RepID=UPI00226ED27F|nr:ThiF family adenylyltransferase [Pyxidicoccus sp. MSG2]MCY1018628.1 ThiF family adenylyltransferase [Pyxidicoccus sp. MSG2]
MARSPSGASARPELSGEWTLTGHTKLSAHVVTLSVHLPAKFPWCLPEIGLEDVQPPVVSLPHLIAPNQLCFPEDTNLLDSDDPYAIARESLVYAREQLGRMLEGNPGAEFAQEAVVYWRSRAEASADCVVSAGEFPSRIVALFQQGRLLAVADSPDVYGRSRPERSVHGLKQREAIYVPLGSVEPEQDFHPMELTTLAGLQKHVRAMPKEARRWLSRVQGRELLLVLGLRRPCGERALLGVRLVDVQGGNPLMDAGAQARVEPIDLQRRDHAFLAPRGGAGTDLKNRKVLLAGCGAVGGYIALSLARAGVGELSLVDSDFFTLENTYRHACGMAWRGLPKVDGLQRELERTIPYVSVKAYPAEIEALMAQRPSVLREHHLVISALGHPTTELFLNRRIWSDATHPPALFTWLEPMGLGGHALLTHLHATRGAVRGCLKCLYARTPGGGAIRNRASFAMPGASYTRDLLGCGSRYLPFSDLDAQRTAELATRLALQALRGEAVGAPLLSWKGERKAFEQEGYTVTPLYTAEPDPSGYVREDCPECAPR